MTVDQLVHRITQGDRRWLARAISWVENEDAQAGAVMAALYPHTGQCATVGITGPPGAGKSTLVDRLVEQWRARGRRVAVVAVDPTSPFTGGALLGDRVRMQQHAEDAGVFIRSMATRGQLGGLARTTGDVAVVLDAAGYEVVVIETVGVGQDEVEIVRTADVSVVVLAPGAGDDMQALKAGVMEIADIYVVNKADQAGADRAAASVEALLSLQTFAADACGPPVLRTEATSGTGMTDLVDAIERFVAGPAAALAARRRSRAGARLRDLVARRLLAHAERRVLAPGEFEQILDRIAARVVDPHTAAAAIAARVIAGA